MLSWFAYRVITLGSLVHPGTVLL